MTFQEWKKLGAWKGQDLEQAMQYAWDAATLEDREACAKHLKDAAAHIAPEGKRTNQYDRHMADVLNEKADELLKRHNAKVTGASPHEGT